MLEKYNLIYAKELHGTGRLWSETTMIDLLFVMFAFSQDFQYATPRRARMNLTKAWDQFVMSDALPNRNEQLHALHHYFRTNKFEIARELVQLFHELCIAIEREQSEGEMEACETIQISLLRTSLAEGQMVYELKVYDRNTQENSGHSPYLYHAEWTFSFLEAWMQACEDKRRAYMGQVSRAAIDAWKNEHVFPFHAYVPCCTVCHGGY